MQCRGSEIEREKKKKIHQRKFCMSPNRMIYRDFTRVVLKMYQQTLKLKKKLIEHFRVGHDKCDEDRKKKQPQ